MAQPQQQVIPEDFSDSAAWTWIAKHERVSVADLRLKYGLERPYFSWISQLEAKRKYARKFGPLFEKQWLFPTSLPLEQSSSYATAWFKATLVTTPYSIDLCAGMGIDSYALSRRPELQEHWANELNPDLAQLLQHNLPNLKVSSAPAEELFGPIEAWKQALNIGPEDLTLYVDPDRRTSGNKAHSIEHTVPHLPSLQRQWLECAHTIISKHSPMASLEELKQLQGCTAIYVVEFLGECKELLCVQRKNWAVAPDIHTVVILQEEDVRLFTTNTAATPISHTGQIHTFLVQPGPALSKSGGHEELLGGMGAKKLVTGNLYTSEHLPAPNELYERYEVIEIAKPYKIQTPVDRAAIERIGFPEHPDVIREKLKINEGREMKIFAMKLGTQKQMILARRLD
ncbi:MAG: hypothetical protein L7U78_05845 [Schleiferiaceae bacterium]|nr:hypothetical protein [Schleiferiaceae bacterium]